MFTVRHTLTSAAAVAAFALICAAAALEAPDAGERQRQILDRIHEIQERDGPYSPALLDELKALVVLYRESEDHTLAVVAIEQALQVMRANSGLYSLDQVPLLWQRIESEEARGNHEEVWDLEQELLTLVRRHPDDLQTVPMLRDMADRQMAVLARVVDTGEIPPQVIYGCYYQEWPTFGGSCNAGSRTTVVQGMLAEANRNHADAIATLLRNEAYSSNELRELEMELVRGAHLIREEYEDKGNRGVTGTHVRNDVPVPLVPWSPAADQLEPWRSRMAPVVELAEWELPYDAKGTPEEEFLDELGPRDARYRTPYHRGRQSLRRLYVYSASSSGPVESRASAIVDMADWDLLFSRNGLAVDGYTLARGMLEAAGADDFAIAQLFAPELPVVLPSFEANPLARDEARTATGHIDVAFAITKYGRARGIEVRDAANAAEADRTDLENLLKSRRFRPRLTHGGLSDSELVAVRYYLYEE